MGLTVTASSARQAVSTPQSSTRQLAGGYGDDPDLRHPEAGACGVFAGLHILRHLDRYLQSLGMELVLTGELDEFAQQLSGDYGYAWSRVTRELGRYRKARTSASIRRILRHEPQAVPLFAALGTACIGWNEVSWEGVHLDERLVPGRIIALHSSMIPQTARPWHRSVHMAAWQAPFPSHSLVSWHDAAELQEGPIELPDREVLGYMFHTGTSVGHVRGDAVDQWWSDTNALTLSAVPPAG